jgi:DNA replication licensing factor MCM3
MMSNETEEERQFLDEHKRKFRNFLNPPDDDGEYVDRIHELRNAGQNRLIVNLDELRAYDNDLANGVLNDPLRYMRPLEGAVTEVADALNTADDDGSMQLDEEDDTLGKRRKKDNNKYFVGVEGSFGANHTTPRGLTSKLLSKMVCVEGIVTKVSVVRPKVKKSVHYCPKTKKHVLRNYRDATSLDGPATSSVYPTKDEEGNLQPRVGGRYDPVAGDCLLFYQESIELLEDSGATLLLHQGSVVTRGEKRMMRTVVDYVFQDPTLDYGGALRCAWNETLSASG